MSELSLTQKATIGKLARAAWLAWAEREAFLAINTDLSPSACYTAWRHVEQGKACGVQSLCACTQDHYGRLVSHFQALGGDAAAAARTLVRDADNGRRIARYKLGQELSKRGLQVGYAAAICRSKYKCDLADASEGQLWKLVFDIRNRHKPEARCQKSEVSGGNPF